MKISGFEWDWKKKPLWTNNFLFSICCTYTIYIQGNLLCLSREMDPLYSFCDTYFVTVFLAWETSLRFSLFELNLIYFQDPKQILLQVQKYQLPCVLISVIKLIEWCFIALALAAHCMESQSRQNFLKPWFKCKLTHWLELVPYNWLLLY